jgi:hypothetical protein
MNATVKTILALAAVVATVFGLTVISQYTRKPDRKDDPKKPGDDIIEEIVRYDMRQMKFDPNSQYYAHRQFPGYFEAGESVNAYFWVNNPNPFPVKVGGARRSCTSCTDVSIAVFDKPFDIDEYIPSITPNAALFGGVTYSAPDQFNAEAWSRAAAAISPARWQALNFDKPEAKITIPAAGESGPTWVAIRLRIVAKLGPHIQMGNKSGGISADLTFSADAAKNPQQTQFVVEYIGVPPFDIYPKELKFLEMPEGVAESSRDVMYYSATQANLPPPVLSADQQDPFLKFGEPRLLNEGELKQFIAEQQFIADQGGAKARVKILAVYRTTVTLSRKSLLPNNDGKELDVGPLEKSFTVTASSGTGASHSLQAQVKTTVGGVVALDGGTGVIDLGDFDSRSGTSKEATLVSEKADLELEALPSAHHPDFLQATLGETRIEGSRRYWTVTVKIERNQGLSNLPPGSAAVFRVKSTGQIIRIPVKGHGKLRSK